MCNKSFIVNGASKSRRLLHRGGLTHPESFWSCLDGCHSSVKTVQNSSECCTCRYHTKAAKIGLITCLVLTTAKLSVLPLNVLAGYFEIIHIKKLAIFYHEL